MESILSSMENIPTNKMLVWTAAAAAVLLLVVRQLKAMNSRRRLPPGPRSWPVLGNLLDLGEMAHASLANMKNVYGPLIWIRLGSTDTLIISSADAAAEMFKNHDVNFCDRYLTECLKADPMMSSAIALANHGPHWRSLRRLTKIEIFSSKRIEETQVLRRKCVDNLINWISEHEVNHENLNKAIELTKFVSATTFNMMSNLVFSMDLITDLKSKNDLFEICTELLKLTAIPNVADFVPSVRWLDPQGIKKKMKNTLDVALDMISKFVEARRSMDPQKKLNKERERDFLDAVLEFQADESNKFSNRNLYTLLLELFPTGIDSTVTTIEWVITELLHNPEAMNKAKAEIAQVIGHARKLEESDIEDLHYLNAVVKETLRLHPPAPFLVPRSVVKDTELMGYVIPKDTQVFVNAFALGRDPSTWNDPLAFKPERFQDSDSTTDYRGQHYELLPFGSGRRVCPGLPLAHNILHLVIGSLLQSFEWALEDGLTPETMDMGEKLGTTLRKAIPLKAVPKSIVKWKC